MPQVEPEPGSGSETRPHPAVKRSRLIRTLMAFTAAIATVVSMGVLGPVMATADTAPVNPADPKTPLTVSADALATVQINGVAWYQAIIGNTVYVAGRFSTARPAGAAPNTQTVTRNNILAYDLRTGNLINSFAPNLNAQAYSIAASPDGSRLYVGGDFTSINGTSVWRVAALNPTTGAVITSFLPRMGASVRAIAVTGSTVYLGGLFPNVGSAARNRLAALRASDGALLSWAPNANNRVNALTLAPAGNQVIVGGVFTTLNGSNRPGYGLGRVDAVTGNNLSLDANNVVRDAGPQSAILSLSSDGTNFYGTGYIYGTGGNLEGAFSGNWSDGKIKWVQDCHGDSYGVWASSTAVYVAGHAHYCLNIGGFPETSPRSYHRALAFSKAATGVMTRDTQGYPSFTGVASPSLLNWYPDLDTGTVTGQNQGPWTVTGTEQYVAMAGEFRNVNGKAQQGLVRFAVSSLAPNKEGPRGTITPTASYVSPGTTRVTWQTYWDRDNKNLTYSVIRDGNTASPVHVIDQETTFWQRPSLSFTDSGLSAGSHRYQISTKDPFGNTVQSGSVTVNVPVGGTGNSPPVAAFSTAANGLQLSVDASSSSDPDGTVSAYSWNFGDSQTATGRQATHTYAQAGSYQVRLTVTDNGQATTSTTKTVQVTTTPQPPDPPVGGAVAQDNFDRVLGSGLGSADTGGAWSLNGAASYFGVASGMGQWKMPRAGTGPSAYLRSVSSTSADATMVFSLDRAAAGGPAYVSLAGRSVGSAGDYRAKVRFDVGGQVVLYVTRVVGSTETTLAQATVAGMNYRAGDRLQLRIQATGTSPTAVKARIWAAGTTEPTTWQVSGTDATAALQAGGGVGIVTYVSSAASNTPLTLRVESLLLVNPGGGGDPLPPEPEPEPEPEPPVPPVGGAVALDNFDRVLGSGLGSADTGGAWSLNGAASYFGVASGMGQWKMPRAGTGPSAYLRSVSSTSADATMVFSLDRAAAGGPAYVSLAGRSVGSAGDYRAKVRFDVGGRVVLYVTRVVGSTETTLAQATVAGMNYRAGDRLQLRIQATGTSPTAVKARIWAAGTTEPTTWQVSGTDATAALQAGGGVGIVTYVSSAASNTPLTLRVESLAVNAP